MIKENWLLAISIVSLGFSQFSYSDTTHMTARDRLRLCRCTPSQSCWPREKAWTKFKAKLTGKLTTPLAPLAPCLSDATSGACEKVLTNLHNPFMNEQTAGGTQSQGWFNAWQNKMSVYALEAETAEDVANAVKFAHNNKIKLIIKGTGHDYLGRSNAPDSLMVWTHKMRNVTYNDIFTPTGCSRKDYQAPAVTVGAGARWLDVYQEVTGKHHRYVQGGRGTTVGAVGSFPQGGGFGPFSKHYGTAASNMLQAEVVTARGDIIIANQCQHEDLFWALKGGGGGTFGVVTSMTFATYPLPNSTGIYKGTITAKNDDAYRILLEQFLVFFRQYLNNDHWGEQFSFDKDNQITISMAYQGLDKDQIDKTWEPLTKWLTEHADVYSYNLDSIDVPPENLWDESFFRENYPEMININSQKSANNGEFWWVGETKEPGSYWYTYQSLWLPLNLFEDEKVKTLSNLIFKASRLAPLAIHSHHGLAGASYAALKRNRDIAMNPNMLQSAGLLVMSASDHDVYPGVENHEVDIDVAKESVNKINEAMQLFYKEVPNAGTEVNEADYFQKNWQEAFWGENYTRLLDVKNQYDPDGFFYCHHCVGSEKWQEEGMCKVEAVIPQTA